MNDPKYALVNAHGRVECLVFVEPEAGSATPEGCQLVPFAELPARWLWSSSDVPVTITRRQLKEWLIEHDKLDAVEAAMNSLPDPKERKKAFNWWTEATDFLRDHPLVGQIGAALGMTEDEIDAAFKEAAAL